MKILAVALVVSALTPAAFAQWTQNNLINIPGGGTGAIAGSDLSSLETGETLFGVGTAETAVVRVADDFTVGAGGWNVTGFRFYLYQTGATVTSITGINWAVDSAPSLSLAAGSISSVNWWSPNGVGVYRVSASTTDANRRIQEVIVDVPDFFLGAGTYWLSYSTAGSLASGPWAPPIPPSQSVNGLNAQQSISNAAYTPLVNGPFGVDLPFVIEAQPVPEPASMAALGLGALALIRRRRAKK
jgi:hypothetical protein